ncbi:unnamed protein product, partial [Amoebophrya sp. A25]
DARPEVNNAAGLNEQEVAGLLSTATPEFLAEVGMEDRVDVLEQSAKLEGQLGGKDVLGGSGPDNRRSNATLKYATAFTNSSQQARPMSASKVEEQAMNSGFQKHYEDTAKELYLCRWGFVEQAIFLKNPNEGAIFYVSINGSHAAGDMNSAGPSVIPGFILTADEKSGFKQWADRLALLFNVPFSFYTDKFTTCDYNIFGGERDTTSVFNPREEDTFKSAGAVPAASVGAQGGQFLSRVSRNLSEMQQQPSNWGATSDGAALLPYHPAPLREQRRAERQLWGDVDFELKTVMPVADSLDLTDGQKKKNWGASSVSLKHMLLTL